MRIELDIPITLAFVKITFEIPCDKSDEHIEIRAVSNDTRELFPFDLYFAIKGERFDGEDFITEAKTIGAYTVSSAHLSADVFVPDTSLALLKLAKAYKRLFNIRETVAITGSVGKTTAKNLSAMLTASKFKTHSTAGNLNNEIGVPFTLFGIKRNTEILIVEAGMNHRGELHRISECIEPTIAVITNIGTAHIGNLGSREQIARAKLEILDGMNKKILLIPYGEPLLANYEDALTVSTESKAADFSLSEKSHEGERLVFDYFSPEFTAEAMEMKATRPHIKKCMAFAIAVAVLVGVSEGELRCAIKAYDLTVDSPYEKIGSITVIDDSYNSSPEAVRLALEDLAQHGGKRYSALLGDMLELGDMSETLHRNIGFAAARAGLFHLYAFGNYAEIIKEGALIGGMKEDCIFTNTNLDDPWTTAKHIRMHSSCETLLIKASNKINLKRIKEILKKTE